MKTTKKDFEDFKQNARIYQLKLGLTNWSFYFEHVPVKGAYAQTHWTTSGFVATLQFATSWDKTRPKNDHELDKLALHEVLHVLLAPLVSEAEWRYTTQEAIESTEHSIIRSLEHIV